MPVSRRDFVATSSLAVAAGLFGRGQLFAQQPAPAQPPTVPAFAPIRRNVGTFTARGGTMGWLITPDAVLVIDSQFADTSQMFLEGMKSRTTRKFDLLVNSHHHPDHTGGNQVLRPNVGKIVAHANVPGLQRKQAAAAKSEAAQAYADETFTDTWKTTIGNEVVSAKYYGPGHTSGDAVITFERANIVHMGDLMSHQRHPRVDRPSGAAIKNWLVTLETVTKAHDNDTVYIFGHSKVGLPVTGSRRDVLALRDYFTALLDYVQKGVAAGKSADELVKTGLPGFADHEGAPQIQVAYEELTAKA
jgi:glyoxylase-like metal-dependent hydrolase (beta-lactamase superfamily II)